MAVRCQYFPLKPLEPLELFSLSLFGTEFVHKAAKLRTMAAEPRKMAPAVRTMATEINYVKPFS